MELPKKLIDKYDLLKEEIISKLNIFSSLPKQQYFYELCFCLCTPQSKAESALRVQLELEGLDFLNNDIDPTPILRNPESYIRFHNQKSKRLIEAKTNWKKILDVLESNNEASYKREWLNDNVKGIGMKESAHFLRNIGYRNLGILDRHILKHLVHCGVYKEIPKISSKKQYIEVENEFIMFSKLVGIELDHLDLLFWSYEAGSILK